MRNSDNLKYFKLAKQLNFEHSKKLKQHDLHYRANLNSFSLISLSKSLPEIGFSNLKTIATGKRKLEEFLNKKNLKTKGRETREKELQSWIIKDAINNDNKIYFDNDIEFLTSELTLTIYNEKKDRKEKISNDILGINKNNDIVIIELKSRRDKKRLEEQVDNFMKAIDQNSIFIENLVKLLTKDKEWNKNIKNIIVWPELHKSKRLIWLNNIQEFTYQEIIIDNKALIDYDESGNIKFRKK